MNYTPDCCEHWPRIAPLLRWWVAQTDVMCLVMPCIVTQEGEFLRVNHCPVCGADRRDTVEPPTLFQRNG